MAQPLLPNKLNSSMKTFYEGLVRPSRTSIKPSTRSRTSTRPSRTNTKKRCPFNPRWLECKSRKSRDTWSNRQIWPWNTKWSRSEANRVLPRECTGHNKHLFQQHKRRLYTWTSPDGQYWNQIDSILCSWIWRSSIQSAKTRLGADCGTDHEFLIDLNWRSRENH